MDDKQAAYAAVKPHLGALAGPLVERSAALLRDRSDFLPHAAVLTSDGRVSAVGAMCNTRDGFANSWHIMPMLHDGLRAMANEKDILAIGIAERANEIPGIATVAAIKIHLEHRRKYALAIYLPYARQPDGRFDFGKQISVEAELEVKVWTQGY
jgi:hypothetical protein